MIITENYKCQKNLEFIIFARIWNILLGKTKKWQICFLKTDKTQISKFVFVHIFKLSNSNYYKLCSVI